MSDLKDGIFKGVANGYHDLIHVEVYIEDGKIEKIEYQHKDTPDTGGMAIQYLVKEIVKKQTVDIPRVPGARYSSIGLKNAVSRALDVSRGKLEQEEANTVQVHQTDGKYESPENNDMVTKTSEKKLDGDNIHVKGGRVASKQVAPLLQKLPIKFLLFDEHGKLQFYNFIDQDQDLVNRIGEHLLEIFKSYSDNDYFQVFNKLRNREIEKMILADRNDVKYSVSLLEDSQKQLIGYLQIIENEL